MGIESQETKSLPRNRKCGNCRFFEPAPLWKKGWCRNPQLYPPHANHLVDSTGIDCEKGFRSRIYWEPLPEQKAEEVQPAPVVKFQERVTQSVQPITPLGATFKPAEYIPEQDESLTPETPPPPEYTRLPEPRDETGWRAEVRKRFRFTENWPLEKMELSHLILWGAALLLVLVALVVFVASGHKQPDPKAVAATAAAATQDAQSLVLGGTAYASIAPLTPVTPTVNPATATALAIVGKTGKVTGLGGQALNVRQDASINAKVLTRLKEGDRVKVVGGPKAAEGQNWLQVEVNGQTGWVSDKYLALE